MEVVIVMGVSSPLSKKIVCGFGSTDHRNNCDGDKKQNGWERNKT